MKIACISDTHNKHGHILQEELQPADIIICAGDISGRGYKSEILNFLHWYSKLDQYKYKILIAGNHDFLFEDNKEKAQEMLKEFPNIIYLEDSGVEIEGFKIWGSPVQPWFYSWAFNRREDIQKHWDMIPGDTDIVITHGPVLGVLDRAGVGGERVGCPRLREKLLQIKPKLCIYGHIHDNYVYKNNGTDILQGIETEDTTLCVNASMLNDNYILVNEPIIVEYDEINKKFVEKVGE